MHEKFIFMNDIQFSISQLNSIFNTRFQLYKACNIVYFLPEWGCKAIDMEYLENIQSLDPNHPKILAIERTSMNNEVVDTRNKQYDALGLLNTLEELCKEKHLPPTGFTSLILPNVEWLLKVIKHIDPEDEYNVFARKVSITETITRNINPKSSFSNTNIQILFVLGYLMYSQRKDLKKERVDPLN